jgi:catechol 2,3-dioxygenase-like lactoylglutathione lyase family enzyme
LQQCAASQREAGYTVSTLAKVGVIAMIDHTGIGVADVARSAAFYDAALSALGLRRVTQLPADSGADAVGYGVDYPVFWIDRFHPPGVKQHTAFAARNRAAVDAFHAAALKAGGTDNGPPGLRDTAAGYPPGYYAAFVFDPEGNNMEAVFRSA